MPSKKSSDDTQPAIPVTDETDVPTPGPEPKRTVEAWAEEDGLPAANWKVRATMAFMRWSEGDLVTKAEYVAAMQQQMNQVTR